MLKQMFFFILTEISSATVRRWPDPASAAKHFPRDPPEPVRVRQILS